MQSGAAEATRLFSRVGPAGAVTLRLVFAAVVLMAVVRPRLRGRRRTDVAVVAGFGVVLGAMNLSFYEAISRIPLGVAVTIEFVGPLAVAVAGSRRRADLGWAVLAAVGVALLAAAPTGHLDRAGILLALAAGGCWAGYIILNRETGRRSEGLDGLALAMVVAAVVVAPLGVASAGGALLRPTTAAAGLGVAVASSALPYALELVALRSVTPRAFGILLSLDPAVAALAGLLILGQHLGAREMVAIAAVVAANVGSNLSGRRATTDLPVP